MNIRAITKNDYETVCIFLQELHLIHVDHRPDFYVDAECILQRNEFIKMVDDQSQMMVACSDNEDGIIGICLASEKNNEKTMVKSLYIDALYVKEGYREQGVGTKLFEEIKKLSKKRKIYRIDLMVWAFNEGAYEFYKKMGMRVQRWIMETD